MALLGICPPNGPWPTPPWCMAGTSNYGGFWAVVSEGKCPPPGPWPQPPWCDDPENLAKQDEDTEVTFWVTLPYQMTFDSVAISIAGGEPIPMAPVGELSYSVSVSLPGKQAIQYIYLVDGSPINHTYSTEVIKKGQAVYDPILTPHEVKPGIIIFVDDTWGRNYNMTWTEDTRKNIDSTFMRLAALGVKEVMVNDFYWAVYDSGGPTVDNLDYHIEGEIFENDHRDEAMTQDDLNDLASAAHKYGMKIIWRNAYILVNLGEYMTKPDIFGSLYEDLEAIDGSKTEAWVRDFLGKWQVEMVQKAIMLEEAGFNSMVIDPGYYNMDYQPYEAVANELFKGIISDLRQEFHGTLGAFIHEIYLEKYETIGSDWEDYFGYYRDLDFTLVFLGDFSQRSNYVPSDLSVESMESSFDKYLDDLEGWSLKAGLRPSVGFYCHSIKAGFINGGWQVPGITPLTATNLLERDWLHQADCVEAMFRAIQDRTVIDRVYYHGYHWDDKMDPDTAIWPISLDPSFRTKPGEAVFQKWMLSDWADSP